ncbi:dephospho-CoA kinase [Chitiniphilus purpureus]|uniref:Dephospho-CoA kinase n=1 Tax=Chitiniphilus purpureus TaxID=2981137 RepID=A0ABY6DQE4_9NEIS|nr:dephospho-CoA kinase [Chitiniphilus sp. CD1]UXY16589.1 dephospho-CoA kinase [Chitiniphilus sp. CD1]
MQVVGLTGGVGSGKSTAARLFAGHGAPIVDTDEIAHRLSLPPSPVLPEIRAAFGSAYLLADGSLDRARMRETIFNDRDAKAQLEALLHPHILQEAKQALAVQADTTPYALLVAPLLFEAPEFHALTKRSLLIDCDEALQLERVSRRPGLTTAAAQDIMRNQMPRRQRLALADDIIENNGSLEALARAVKQWHLYYLDWSKNIR